MSIFKNKKTGLSLSVAGFLFVSCEASCKRVEALSTKPVVELTPKQQRKYDYFLLGASRLKIQKDRDAAFDLLQHCLTINPNAPSTLYELVQYYLFLEQALQGQAALEKAAENDPGNYWYSQGLANLYQQQDEKEKAVRLLEDISVHSTDKLDPLYALLDTYNRWEQYNKVVATPNRIEGKTGKSEQLSMEKFRIYLQMKDNKNAFHETESLAAEYSMDTRHQVVLDDVYMQSGKKDEAYDIYRKVLDVEPDNAMAMYSPASYYEAIGQKELHQRQLGILLLNKKVPSETRMNVTRQLVVQNEQDGRDSTRVTSPFDRILEQEPDNAGIPILYVQYPLSKGMNKEALPVLRRVLAIDPANTAAHVMLLGEAVKEKNYGNIIELCEAGVKTNPETLEFHFYSTTAYNQAERTDDVITVCRKVLSHTTDESKKEVVPDFYSILGNAYHTKDSNMEAYAAYGSVLVYNPSDIGALNNYAYYLSVEHRNLDKVEKMSYKTVRVEPDNATYLDICTWVLSEKGNYAKARLYIDDAMKDNGGKSDVIVEHCDDIYYMTGDMDKALEYWKQTLEIGSKSKTLKQKIRQKKYIGDK